MRKKRLPYPPRVWNSQKKRKKKGRGKKCERVKTRNKKRQDQGTTRPKRGILSSKGWLLGVYSTERPELSGAKKATLHPSEGMPTVSAWGKASTRMAEGLPGREEGSAKENERKHGLYVQEILGVRVSLLRMEEASGTEKEREFGRDGAICIYKGGGGAVGGSGVIGKRGLEMATLAVPVHVFPYKDVKKKGASRMRRAKEPPADEGKRVYRVEDQQWGGGDS